MTVLAGHGKDPRLAQLSLIAEFQIGDRVVDNEKFEGVLTSINDKHFTIKNEDNIKCFNLSLHKKPIHKLISHISISSRDSFGIEHRDFAQFGGNPNSRHIPSMLKAWVSSLKPLSFNAFSNLV